MKEWWQERSQREKSIVSIGGVIFLVIIIYLIIWQPINDSINRMQQDNINNAALLSWMKQADAVLAKSHQSNGAHKTTSATERLAAVQTSLQSTPFKRNVAQVAQTQQNDVRVQIKKAYFDDLSSWLVSIWQNNGIAVKTLNIRRLSNQGQVTANIILAGPQ